MITRRKIGLVLASLVGGSGLGAAVGATAFEADRTADEDYQQLCRWKELFTPGLYVAQAADPFQRELNIQRIVLGDDELRLESFNGVDRKYRLTSVPITALRMNAPRAMEAALARVLPIESIARSAVMLSMAQRYITKLNGEQHPVEYEAWKDFVTDNVLIKAYDPRTRHALGYCIKKYASLRALDDRAMEAAVVADIKAFANAMQTTGGYAKLEGGTTYFLSEPDLEPYRHVGT